MDIYSELKEIRHSTQQIELILAKNTASLEEHMRRTKIMEDRVDELDKDFLKVKGFVLISGWIVAIAGAILTIFFQLKH